MFDKLSHLKPITFEDFQRLRECAFPVNFSFFIKLCQKYNLINFWTFSGKFFTQSAAESNPHGHCRLSYWLGYCTGLDIVGDGRLEIIKRRERTLQLFSPTLLSNKWDSQEWLYYFVNMDKPAICSSPWSVQKSEICVQGLLKQYVKLVLVAASVAYRPDTREDPVRFPNQHDSTFFDATTIPVIWKSR